MEDVCRCRSLSTVMIQNAVFSHLLMDCSDCARQSSPLHAGLHEKQLNSHREVAYIFDDTVELS